MIDYFWEKFLEIIKIIKDKIFGKKEEQEQYMDVSNELYNNCRKSDDFERLNDKI